MRLLFAVVVVVAASLMLAVPAAAQDCKVLDIAAGDAHTCVLLDGGRVKCWGSNLSGQLGLGDNQPRGMKPSDMGDALPYVDLGAGVLTEAVAAGANHTCALLTTGRIKCWGDNRAGQLGLGDTDNRGSLPNHMGDALPFVDLGNQTRALGVTAGEFHTCALLVDRVGDLIVKCWGSNYYGQLGLPQAIRFVGFEPGQMGDSLPAVNVTVSGANRTVVTGLSAGGYHTCATLTGGLLKCWGDNSFAQLGLGSLALNSSFLPPAALPFVDVGAPAIFGAAGYFHTCAAVGARSNFSVKCWGYSGSIGNERALDDLYVGDAPSEMGSNLPTVRLAIPDKLNHLTSGNSHVCVASASVVKCWGINTNGQVGFASEDAVGINPGQMGESLPAVDLGSVKPDAVVTGYNHTCVALAEGAGVKCWGGNAFGQLGLGDTRSRNKNSSEMGDALPQVHICGPPPSPPMPPPGPFPPGPAPAPSPLPALSPAPPAPATPSKQLQTAKSVPVGAIVGAVVPSVIALAAVAVLVALWVTGRLPCCCRPALPSPPPPAHAKQFDKVAQLELPPSTQHSMVPAAVHGGGSVSVQMDALGQSLTGAGTSFNGGATFTALDGRASAFSTSSAPGYAPSRSVYAPPAPVHAAPAAQPQPRSPTAALTPAVASAFRWMATRPVGAVNVYGRQDAKCRRLERPEDVDDICLVADGLLGVGATSAVYECVWPRRFAEGQVLAAKVLKRAPADPSDSALAAFRKEAETLALLNERPHPGIPRVYGFHTDPPRAVIVMDLLPVTLHQALATRGALPRGGGLVGPWPATVGDVLQVAHNVASTLAHLHSLGMVHRDLKPANILVAPDRSAKLADFGLTREQEGDAVATAHGGAGTLHYMAPEVLANHFPTKAALQLVPREITPKVDVYSLGVIMWQLVAKGAPWELSVDQVVQSVAVGSRPQFYEAYVGGEGHAGDTWGGGSTMAGSTMAGSQRFQSMRTAASARATFSAMPEYRQLIEACWAHAADDRPSAAEVVERLQRLLDDAFDPRRGAV